MKGNILLLLLLVVTKAQSQLSAADSIYLIQYNQRIDDAVVGRNIKLLDSAYANDFVFSHGSGNVQSKEAWLKSVTRNTWPERRHDSVRVELHSDLAVVKGNMILKRIDKDKTALYRLKYIRVYAIRDKRWQLVSHSTIYEVHDN